MTSNKMFEYKPKNPCLASYGLILPGQHLLWDRYAIGVIHLREEEGLPPAVKLYTDATHEITMYAVDPKVSTDDFMDGCLGILTPVNYCFQIKTTDEVAVKALKFFADGLLRGKFLAEPEGVSITFRQYVAGVISLGICNELQ